MMSTFVFLPFSFDRNRGRSWVGSFSFSELEEESATARRLPFAFAERGWSAVGEDMMTRRFGCDFGGRMGSSRSSSELDELDDELVNGSLPFCGGLCGGEIGCGSWSSDCPSSEEEDEDVSDSETDEYSLSARFLPLAREDPS